MKVVRKSTKVRYDQIRPGEFFARDEIGNLYLKLVDQKSVWIGNINGKYDGSGLIDYVGNGISLNSMVEKVDVEFVISERK